VRLARDGTVVVHHDDTLERTTSGRGRIGAYSSDELAGLDAGHWFKPTDAGHDFPFRASGVRIPLLGDVLARYPGIPLIIELKQYLPELAHKTIEHVRRAGAINRVALGSFSWRVLRAARAYEPAIVTGASREETRLALYRSWVGWRLRDEAYREFQVPEKSGPTRIVSPRFVRHAHRAGIPVKVWTVNDADDMRRLISWGVDAIITDRPDVAVGVMRGTAEGPAPSS
jgi:glycerophosphoryl diester phosphodiesterase